MRMNPLFTRGAAAAAAFLALAGCGSSSTTDAGTPATDTGPVATDTGTVTDAGTATDVPAATDVPTGTDVPAAPLPVVTITSPASGANFPYATATAVNITASNFTLEDFPPIGMAAPTHGHYHVYLDMADGNDYLFADYRPTAQVIIPPGTAPGMHSIRVSLRHHDHSAVGTAGADVTLPIMVTAQTGPSVQITSPSDSASVTAGGTVNVAITTAMITLVAPSATNNPAQGHYAVYLDSRSGSDTLTAENMAPMTTVTIPAGTTPGPHRIRVSLRNNDNSPLGAEAGIRITVH